MLIRFARVCSNVDDFNDTNLFLTAKLLKQGYIDRALTRILKMRVPEPPLPKSGSPTIQKNITSFKKWESQHQKWEFRTANQQLVRALIDIIKFEKH